ncbi:hypothetical protein TD95_004879 [Thielaviopsis punctulata]|uniref:DNA polymerase alpha subunit B n=1 Tax=Thielaviopsis punctulata TaxID=72032 RepID=A0A0F4Z6M4_9PEZI|nr:hypothetical protein TD95_004879 [Thielaviopsis punctulata]
MSDPAAVAAAAVELASFFPGAEQYDADIIAELASIRRMHDLSVEDMYYKWESYCIKMERESADVSLAAVRMFKQDVQNALEKSMRLQSSAAAVKRSAAPQSRAPRVSAAAGDVFGMLDGLMQTPGRPTMQTPAKKTTTPSARRPADTSSTAATPSKFSDRANPGEVVEVFAAPAIPDEEFPIMPFAEPRVKLTAGSDQKKLAYKPLAMKLSEASEILDDRIDEFMDIVADALDIDTAEFGSPANQSTAEIVAVGRIANDSAEGRLNTASLVMETSRRMGNGLRVPLNVSKLRGFSFFPGQIVAVRGSNVSGAEFVVSQVLDLPLLPNAASDAETLAAHVQRLRADPDAMDGDGVSVDDVIPLNCMIASGPYTADDNLEFEPLAQLCTEAAEKVVDTVLLFGPFIDIDHPLIASGDFDLPPDAGVDPDTATLATVFRLLILPHLSRVAAANPSVTIILIPSVRDAVNKHVSWPQDALPRKELGLPRCARVLANPMTLCINEATFGLSAQDVLFELRREEVVGGVPKTPDALSRLCGYVLEQRHFFPLFPAADRGLLMRSGAEDGRPPGASLDTAFLKLGEMVKARPDVLVLPSSLPPFVKVVESVLVINPGLLSRRAGAGTYARLAIYPPKIDTSVEPSVLQPHSVFSRSRVEIVRI